MTHTYTITGMRCNGCKSKVENALNGIEGVEAVVLLEGNSASISMKITFQRLNFKNNYPKLATIPFRTLIKKHRK